MIKLFVVGFPREMDEIQLAQLFAPYGDVDLLTIVRDKLTQLSKGFGFVHMRDAEGAKAAIEALNGTAIGDRTLEVRLADEKQVVPAAPVKQVVLPRYEQVVATTKKKRPRISK